jgi:hypothetical protein
LESDSVFGGVLAEGIDKFPQKGEREYASDEGYMKVVEDFLEGQQEEIEEYDEALVTRLIEKITVYDDHLAFEFKSGLETEVQM